MLTGRRRREALTQMAPLTVLLRHRGSGGTGVARIGRLPASAGRGPLSCPRQRGGRRGRQRASGSRFLKELNPGHAGRGLGEQPWQVLGEHYTQRGAHGPA